MDGELGRFLADLIGRITGPMMFRLILQPTMATVMAIRDGLHDASNDQPPYFWALMHDAEHRRDWLRSGWKSIAKIFILAFVLDAVYQWIQLRWFYRWRRCSWRSCWRSFPICSCAGRPTC